MTLSIQDAHILRTRIAPLVSRELLERFRANPQPPHDADIVEVLDFLRRNPDPELPRYVTVKLQDGFAVAARTAPAGMPPVLVDSARYPDRGAAEYAVIERRLRDYGLDW